LYDGARAETAFYAAEISEIELQNVKQVLEKLDVLHEECTTNLSSPEMKDLTKLASFLERAEYALSMEAHNTELAAIAIPVSIHQKQHVISSKLLEKLRNLKNSNSLHNDYCQNTKTWHQPLHDDGIDYITLRLIPWLLKSSNENKQALGQKELGALLAHRSERMEKPALTVTKISQRDDLRHFPASFQPAFT